MTSNLNPEYRPGSILKRKLDGVPGIAYSHVGIYVGEGRVIHFNGTLGSGSSATIEESHLDDFAKGRKLKIMRKPACDTHGEAVVAEARRALEDPGGWNGRYNFVIKNCEDFTRHCFSVEYRDAGEPRKARPGLSQRFKTIAAGVGAAVVTVTTVLGRRHRNRPPQA